jgi:hypothetical protein
MYDALDNLMEEVISSLMFIHLACAFKNASLTSSHRAFEMNLTPNAAKQGASLSKVINLGMN